MRKSYFCLALACLIALAALWGTVFTHSPLSRFLNWGLISAVLVVLLIAAFYFEFERALLTSKEIALVAMLGALAAALRIPFAAVPGAQPSSFIIICSGYVFGPLAGFMIGALTPLISNFFLGHGPWTLYQMLIWGLMGVSAAYIKGLSRHSMLLVLFGIIWGYLYGALVNIWFWAGFVYPLTWRTFLFVFLNSIWFDTLHAAGNAVFLGFFGKRTIITMQRFRSRFQWHFSGNPKDTGG